MSYAQDYSLGQVGLGQLLLDVLKTVNRRFNLGAEGIAGFPLNIEADQYSEFAQITLNGYEPVLFKLNIFPPGKFLTQAEVIRELEYEVEKALIILMGRRDNGATTIGNELYF